MNNCFIFLISILSKSRTTINVVLLEFSIRLLLPTQTLVFDFFRLRLPTLSPMFDFFQLRLQRCFFDSSKSDLRLTLRIRFRSACMYNIFIQQCLKL